MAVINFGGVDENVVTREEFPLEKAPTPSFFTRLSASGITDNT